jgi:hypothetical protein
MRLLPIYQIVVLQLDVYTSVAEPELQGASYFGSDDSGPKHWGQHWSTIKNFTNCKFHAFPINFSKNLNKIKKIRRKICPNPCVNFFCFKKGSLVSSLAGAGAQAEASGAASKFLPELATLVYRDIPVEEYRYVVKTIITGEFLHLQ